MNGGLPSQPYGSALDLPSVSEMLEQIRGMKLLTRFVARHVRSDLSRIEAQIKSVADVVDRFYGLLGDRHWIFHDHLNVERVKGLLDESADDAERGLVALYKEPETLEQLIRTLTPFAGLRLRMNLIQHARSDFLAGRYYSAVLVLLAVMDGFVNDLDSEQRRGLHAREAEDMTAWDSVVGHHQGLTNAHQTFTRSFKRPSDEPVYELFRHGIVHGVLTNFDNDVVATKAWNRLFAVADWAASRERASVPPEPKPTWRALFRQIRENEEAKQALASWKPRVAKPTDEGFDSEPVLVGAASFLDAWKSSNYGVMARHLSALVQEDTFGQTAGRVREEYETTNLGGYSIERLEFEAPAVCEVHASLLVDGENRPGRLRWIRQLADGSPALPNQPGEWKLVLWSPYELINRAKEL